MPRSLAIRGLRAVLIASYFKFAIFDLPAARPARLPENRAGTSAFLFVLGEHGGLLEGFLRFAEGFRGVFHGLLGVLVARLMIFLAVVRGGDAMRVRGQLVKFRCSNVPVSGHDFSRTAGTTVTIHASDVHGDHACRREVPALGCGRAVAIAGGFRRDAEGGNEPQ
jgi:hypothetical protein